LLGKRHEDPAKAVAPFTAKVHGPCREEVGVQGRIAAGAYRETLEETGIKINPSSLEHISTTNNIVEDAHFVTLGFLCKEFTGEAEVKELTRSPNGNGLPSTTSHPPFSSSKQIIDKFLERKA